MKAAILDLGKTNAKLALVDTATACELDVLSMPTPMIDLAPYRHPDVEALWTFFLDSLATLRSRGPIDAIGITTHGATVALLDAEGKLALPVLDYEHEGPDECATDYDAERPSFASTGSPRLPGGLNVGAQLFWQERSFPSLFTRIEHILTWPQYWAWRLCGELASETTSLGAHTDLFEPSTGKFSTLVFERGWDRLFPPIRCPGDKLGLIKSEIAERTGLSADTPVHVGIHDSNASLVPHLLADRTPRAVVSTGTWVIVMALGGETIKLDPSRDTLININAFGAPVPSARFMGGREFELLSRPHRTSASKRLDSPPGGADGESAVQHNNAQFAETSDEADEQVLARVLDEQAMLLPSVVQGSGPFPRHELNWTVRESLLDDAAHAVVVAHYLAMMTVICLDLIGARGAIAIEGPFAANRHFVRMLAAATGRPVEIGVNVTGTSVGTAMLIDPPRMPPVSVSDEIPYEWRSRLANHAALWRERIG